MPRGPYKSTPRELYPGRNGVVMELLLSCAGYPPPIWGHWDLAELSVIITMAMAPVASCWSSSWSS